MIDIKFLRENPEAVKQNIRNKFQDSKLELVDKSTPDSKQTQETTKSPKETTKNPKN